MPFQGKNQVIKPKKQANHRVAFDAPHDVVSGQTRASFCSGDDSSTINACSNIVYCKQVEEGRQSSTTSSIKTRAATFLHALNGRPANADRESHEVAEIDYFLFRK